jgi:hypothetical protein
MAAKVRLAGRPGDTGPFANAPSRLHYGREWVLLHLDQPVLTLLGAVMLSTKLDLDYEQADPSCRIMFCGNVAHIFKDADEHKRLKLARVRSPTLLDAPCWSSDVRGQVINMRFARCILHTIE